ncbi:MAG: hypothetical protein INR64_07885 [Caulobacteraceae bacterium]|nr:hypothetical protein [Caulobacter sp.]
MRRLTMLAAALVLAGCGGGKHDASNTAGGNDTGAAQNALGGVGNGPAIKGAGGVQSSGDTSGDNPQGEVSPSGPGVANSSG